MWIDFSQPMGVLAGLFFGRQTLLFGSDGEGSSATVGRVVRFDRRRRAIAAILASRR